MAFGGNTSKINAAMRFCNRSTYSIVGVGTHYMGLDKKFSGALSYRLGQYMHLSPRWLMGADLGFSHIETFEEHSSDRPRRLYSLQAHLNAEYRISPSCRLAGKRMISVFLPDRIGSCPDRTASTVTDGMSRTAMPVVANSFVST